MPLPLLAVAAIGGASIGASIWKQSSTNKANKKILRLQQQAEERASVARGSQLFNADQALAVPEYDDDPFTSNKRTLYAGGGAAGLDAGFSIANELVSMWGTNSANKNSVAQAQFEANKLIPGSIDQVTNAAQKDADNKAKRFANPYTYKPEDTELFAQGGTSNNGILGFMQRWRDNNYYKTMDANEGLTKQHEETIKFGTDPYSIRRRELGYDKMVSPNKAFNIPVNLKKPTDDFTFANGGRTDKDDDLTDIPDVNAGKYVRFKNSLTAGQKVFNGLSKTFKVLPAITPLLDIASDIGKSPDQLNKEYNDGINSLRQKGLVPNIGKLPDQPMLANGGAVNQSPIDNLFQGVNKQSSNTAIVQAGTHESGNDLEFANPNGSKAKIEGGEGMKTAPNGSVNIYSDRIPVPGENVSIADKFSHLSSLKGNLEKDMKGASNAITKNTLDRKIIGIDATMDELFKVQENVKRAAEYQAQSLPTNNAEVPAIPSAPDQLFANGGTSKFGVNRSQSAVPIPKDVILHAGDDVNNTEEAAKKAEEAKGHTDYDPKKIVVMNQMTPFGTKNFGKNQTQLAAAYNGIDTKKLATPYVDPNAEDGKGNNTFWNTIKSDDGINGIATGLTLLDNLYNARQIKNIDIKDPHYVNKVELDKEYDTTAAEYGVKKELDNFYKNVDKNTTSSIVGLNMKLSAMAEGIDKLNGVYDTKQKYEGEMHNREILANSSIEAQNVGIYNGDKDKQSMMNANIAMQKSANFSNAIDDTVNGLLRYQGMRTDRERFAALENSTAATGVQIGNLRDGLYKDMDAAQIEAGLDKSIANGNMDYATYKEGLKLHNDKAKYGSVVKPMTKAQFDAKLGKKK